MKNVLTQVLIAGIILPLTTATTIDDFSGRARETGVDLEGEQRLILNEKESPSFTQLWDDLRNAQDAHRQRNEPVSDTPKSSKPKVSLPYCTTVSETDAFDLDCMQSDIGVCPEGEFLMVEYTVGANNLKSATGNQWCSATNDVEAAPGTIVEAAEPVEIVVTLRDLQRLEVGASKVLSANMKREGKYVGLRKRPIHMWTEAGVVNRSITMFGQRVQIRLTPVSYKWNYGDGTSQTTTEPGSKVDADFTGETKTSHSYDETGTYEAQVTVSYAGQFRVGSDEWVPVVGMLEIPSETASMDIWRKKVYPVADDCDANPQGWGCDSLFQEEKPNN